MEKILFDDDGKVSGAEIYDGMIDNKVFTVECKAIVIDPEIMPEYAEQVGTIIRAVYITK